MKSYKSNFNRNKSKFKKKSKDLLENLSNEHLTYLPHNINKHLCNTNETVLFENIKEFEFSTVAKRMVDIFKIEHFEKLTKIEIDPNKIYSDNLSIYVYIQL